MSTWVALEPLSASVEAGQQTDVRLRIRNTGDVVEEYHVDVVGDSATWCSIEPSSVRLYPGTTGSVSLKFQPPRSPDATAGPHPYGVRVRPIETPDAVTVHEGNITVAPFTDIRAELMPVTVRGWRHAKPRLVVDNYGNVPLTASVIAESSDRSIDADTRIPAFQVLPGHAHFSTLRLRPTRTLWLGRRRSHPYTATVQPSGAAAVPVNGTYMQSSLMPTWVSRLAMMFVLLAAVFIALWFLAHPGVSSSATSQTGLSPAADVHPVSDGGGGAGPGSGTGGNSGGNSGGSGFGGSSPGGSSGSGGSSSGSGSSGSSTPHAPGLKPGGLWKLASQKGITAVDTVGRNPGKGAHVTWCRTTRCATFNGTSTAFVTKHPAVNTGTGKSFTVSAAVYLATTRDGTVTAVSQSSRTDSGFALQYYGKDKRWSFTRLVHDTRTEKRSDRAISSREAASGRWAYLTGVYDAADHQLRLYVNGKLQHTASDRTPFAAKDGLVIGRSEYGGKAVDWFPGAIRDVETFGDALSSTQVLDLAKSEADLHAKHPDVHLSKRHKSSSKLAHKHTRKHKTRVSEPVHTHLHK